MSWSLLVLRTESRIWKPGAELWLSPLERLDFTVAYMFHNERSDTLFGIPVYDG